eukprot:503574-Pleurochrysis_carterae.AAC.2
MPSPAPMCFTWTRGHRVDLAAAKCACGLSDRLKKPLQTHAEHMPREDDGQARTLHAYIPTPPKTSAVRLQR